MKIEYMDVTPRMWANVIALIDAIQSQPEEGDIVREKKYAQPLEVTKVMPNEKKVEVVPQAQPAAPKKVLKFDEIQPYKKEA